MSDVAGSETPPLRAAEGAPRPGRRRQPLRRDVKRGLLGGVLAGVAPRLGLDPVVLRVLFAIATVATSGVLLLAYLVAWAVLPASGERGPALSPLARLPVRSDWRVGLGVGLSSSRSCSSSASSASGGATPWSGRWSSSPSARRCSGGARRPRRRGRGRAAVLGRGEAADERSPGRRAPGTPFADLYRGVFGVPSSSAPASSSSPPTTSSAAARRGADRRGGDRRGGLILAPFIWRLGRNLAAERAERIRSQERAELAAHLHDSVLQTLTLMQKRADDPREVAALARRQERELREWLAGEAAPPTRRPASPRRCERVAAEVEDAHGVAIEVVAVGDRALDERAEALVGGRPGGAAQRRQVRRRRRARSASTPRSSPTGSRSSSATGRRASTPPPCRPTGAACASRSSAGWGGHGGRAEVRSGSGSGTEVELSPSPRRAGGRSRMSGRCRAS